MGKIQILKKNQNIFKIHKLILPLTMWAKVITLYYEFKGLSFAEIALIQSIGSIFSMLIDIPTGILADKLGDKKFLKISAFFYLAACSFLIFAHNFVTFLITEFLFGFATACKTGAYSSFLYKNIRELGQKDNYVSIVSGYDKNAVPIRMLSMFLAPLLYNLWYPAPFIISAVIYFIIFCLYCSLNETPFVKTIKEISNKNIATESKLKEKAFYLIKKYKNFVLLSLISLIFFTLISNFGQFFSNQIKELGFNISLLGIIYTVNSGMGYFTNMIAPRIKKENKNIFLLLFPIMMSLLLIILYFRYNIYTVIAAYFISSIIATPFNTLLNERIHYMVDDEHRATMLSISEQFDNFSTFLFDPLIGLAIDKCGFRMGYFYLGIVSLLLLSAIGIYINPRMKKTTL